MKDLFGRDITYMRVSITDRCDLRCKYCMPSSVPDISHSSILRYEELLRICRAAVTLGINKFKVTGGEPFVRRGAADFIAALKTEPGVKCVTVTTNATHLRDNLPKLKQAGIDGTNISLDSLSAVKYQTITGSDCSNEVLAAVTESAKSGIQTKVNCVLLDCNTDQIVPLANLARTLPVDVRFIELMPIGYGRDLSGPDSDTALTQLRQIYPDLHYVDEKRGNGPAVYFKSKQLIGRIGFIGANSHQFCANCNRVRLTSTGFLKPCLCYDDGINLRRLIRKGADDHELTKALSEAIYVKPSAHCFAEADNITEHKKMSQIGG